MPTPSQAASASEAYHRDSKLVPWRLMGGQWIVRLEPPARVDPPPPPAYDGCPVVALPKEPSPPRRAFASVVRARRSAERFGGEPIALEKLATVLRLGAGVTGTTGGRRRRAAPSAGALYPVDLHCLVRAVDGLAAGLYTHQPELDRLVQRSTVDPTEEVREAVGYEIAEGAAAVVVLTGALGRGRPRYGERAYRFVLLEAGHVAQNLLLAAEACGLAACPIGGFADDHLNHLLCLDGVADAVVYLVALGSR
jgi:SagB-type dehydrogenase family enzyme